MANAVRFRQSSVARQPGELARLKVVQGPDYGVIFVITAPKATIGRGEDNDIMISDLKSSRNHAVFTLDANGWSIRDAGSANGILFNGKATRNAALKAGDVITLGETSFEFVASEAATLMLVSPPRSPEAIQADQAAFLVQKQKVKSLGLFGGGGTAAGQKNQRGAKSSRSMTLGLLAVGVFVFLHLVEDEGQPKKKTKPKQDVQVRDLASYLPKADLGVAAKTAETFFKAGFREYREKNYLRARSHFETVLQIMPDHQLARIYLNNCVKSIEEEVKNHLEHGKKSLEAGKLRDARGHFEAVIRLLFKDRSSSEFIEAQDQLERVNKELTGGQG